jgi:hypothetical protein
VNEDESYFFRVTEAIFVGWFTLEYIIRFLVAPDKVIKTVHYLLVVHIKGLGHQMIPFLQSYNIQAVLHVIFRMPG